MRRNLFGRVFGRFWFDGMDYGALEDCLITIHSFLRSNPSIHPAPAAHLSFPIPGHLISSPLHYPILDFFLRTQSNYTVLFSLLPRPSHHHLTPIKPSQTQTSKYQNQSHQTPNTYFDKACDTSALCRAHILWHWK